MNKSITIPLFYIFISSFSIGLHAGNFATDTSDVAKVSEEYTTDDFLRAVENGDLEKIELLLANGMDPNSKNFIGTTPLMLALNNCHMKITQLLLDNGADPNFIDDQGKTALMIAEEKNYKRSLQALRNYTKSQIK